MLTVGIEDDQNVLLAKLQYLEIQYVSFQRKVTMDGKIGGAYEGFHQTFVESGFQRAGVLQQSNAGARGHAHMIGTLQTYLITE